MAQKQINVWFVPRSRSTALIRCLSQIPDSKTFFENFLYAFYLGDEDSIVKNYPDLVPEEAKAHVVPGFNFNSVLKQFKESDAKVTILKEFIFTLKGRHDEIIDKESSVNVFLFRDPKYVFTSYLKVSQTYYYEAVKLNDPDITIHYKALLQGIDWVTNNCTKQPIVIDGSSLATKEGAAKAVKAICDAAGIEFSPSFLAWPANEGIHFFNTPTQ